MSIRSLSSLESKVILQAASAADTEVTIDKIEMWASISRSHARKLAHSLSSKHWLQRVGRGRYLVNPASNGPDAIPDRDPLRIGSRLVEPYCFSHSTAANLHGLLKQRFQEYVITTSRRKRVVKGLPVQIRFVMASSLIVEHCETQERRGFTIRFSDKEKTVVDCVDRPDLVGGLANTAQIVASAKPSLRWPRLVDAVARGTSKSTAQRLGWLLDRVRPDAPFPATARNALRRRVGAGYVPLDASAARKGPTDPTWRIQLNRPMGEIMGEVRIG